MSTQISKENFDTVIVPPKKRISFNIHELIEYKDLLWLFVKRDFMLSYKQSVLGPLWLFITPVVSSLVYTLVFGNFAGLSTDGVPKILFYLTSQIVWLTCGNTVSNCANTYARNELLFSKVYFPRIITTLSMAISSLIETSIKVVIIIILYIIYVIVGDMSIPTWYVLLTPLFILQGVLIGWAVGLIISSITIKYRDLLHFLSFFVQLWLYATPVVYTMNLVNSSKYASILLLNPMTAVLNNARFAILGCGEFMMVEWLLSILITFVLVFIGLSMFKKGEINAVDIM